MAARGPSKRSLLAETGGLVAVWPLAAPSERSSLTETGGLVAVWPLAAPSERSLLTETGGLVAVWPLAAPSERSSLTETGGLVAVWPLASRVPALDAPHDRGEVPLPHPSSRDPLAKGRPGAAEGSLPAYILEERASATTGAQAGSPEATARKARSGSRAQPGRAGLRAPWTTAAHVAGSHVAGSHVAGSHVAGSHVAGSRRNLGDLPGLVPRPEASTPVIKDCRRETRAHDPYR